MGMYNELLILLMKEKSERIEDIIKLPGSIYFNEGDREEIKSWSEEESKSIWNNIKKRVHTTAPAGLRKEVCPFCHKCGLIQYKKPFCGECGYGRRHGICGKEDKPSDFLTIIEAFNDMGVVCGRFFNSDYYEGLIENLEIHQLKETPA